MLARVAIVALMIGTAQAATDEPSGTPLQYEAAYFSQFAPRTALDMLQRVPGFGPRHSPLQPTVPPAR